MTVHRPPGVAGEERVPGWLRTAAAYSWRVLLVVAAAGVVLWMLARLYLVTAPLVIALFLATIAVPSARWLERRGLPRTPAALLTVIGGLLVLLGLFGIAVPMFIGEMDDLGQKLGEGREAIVGWLERAPDPISAARVEELLGRASQEIQEHAGQILTGALTGITMVGQIVVIVLLSMIVLFFLIRDGERFVDWALSRVPADRREAVRSAADRAWGTLTGYMRGLVVVAAVDAVAVGIGLAIIGVPLVVPLMLLTFFGAFIPIVGTTVAGAVAVIVALVGAGPLQALLVLALFIIVPQVEGNFLQPLVMGRAVQLHPVVVLLALTAGATLAGITGAFLAVPVAAVIAAVRDDVTASGEDAARRDEGPARHEEG
jgi:putative heme transporter